MRTDGKSNQITHQELHQFLFQLALFFFSRPFSCPVSLPFKSACHGQESKFAIISKKVFAICLLLLSKCSDKKLDYFNFYANVVILRRLLLRVIVGGSKVGVLCLDVG